MGEEQGTVVAQNQVYVLILVCVEVSVGVFIQSGTDKIHQVLILVCVEVSVGVSKLLL